MKKKIAVVEDDTVLSDSLKTGLEDAGFDVVRAFDGEEALKVIETQMPDLVLLDLIIPKIGGMIVAKQIKSNVRTKGIPIIILSAVDSAAIVAEAMANGMYKYILKSDVKIEEVVRRVKQELENS